MRAAVPSLFVWRRCVHTARVKRPSWTHAAAVSAGAAALSDAVTYLPVAVFEGPYRACNGTPRQGALVPNARGMIRFLDDTLAMGGAAALDGLAGFSHAYILWHFHANQPYRTAAKVAPPRLGGDTRVGVFATRSPHRPNPLGLTVVRIERVDGTCVHVSGADLLDGTPVIDVKPYVPSYDAIPHARIPDWLAHAPVTAPQTVHWSPAALAGLEAAAPNLRYCTGVDDAKATLVDALRSELRSPYRRTSATAKLDVYSFYFDCLDVRCSFDDSAQEITVMDIQFSPQHRAEKQSADGIAPVDAATFAALLSPSGLASRVTDQLEVMWRTNGVLIGVPAGHVPAGSDAVLRYDWRTRTLQVSVSGSATTRTLSADDLLRSTAKGAKRLQATGMYLMKGPPPGGVSSWLRPGQRIGVAALWDALAARTALSEEQYTQWPQQDDVTQM